jgi:hypothetical protein
MVPKKANQPRLVPIRPMGSEARHPENSRVVEEPGHRVAVRWVQTSGRFLIRSVSKLPNVGPQHRHNQRFSKFKLVAVLDGLLNLIEVHILAHNFRRCLRDVSLPVLAARQERYLDPHEAIDYGLIDEVSAAK